VIIDHNLPDIPGLDLVRRLLPINAMINTVVISDLSQRIFTMPTRGLGEMAQLPLGPGKNPTHLKSCPHRAYRPRIFLNRVNRRLTPPAASTICPGAFLK